MHWPCIGLVWCCHCFALPVCISQSCKVLVHLTCDKYVSISDAYSIGPRPSGLGRPPTGAPAAAPGPGPGSAPPQAADAGQDAYVTGQHTLHFMISKSLSWTVLPLQPSSAHNCILSMSVFCLSVRCFHVMSRLGDTSDSCSMHMSTSQSNDLV